MNSVLVLNGPNLNMLGSRQTEHYGTATLEDIKQQSLQRAAELGIEIDFRQSNSEGELVDWIQSAKDQHFGIILNAGGYSHTSIAILDAILATRLPVIEVHISNIYARDDFRHHSYVSRGAYGVIAGLGLFGYIAALDAIALAARRE